MIPDRLLWAAWIGHWYPGLTPARMRELSVTQLVDLHEYTERQD